MRLLIYLFFAFMLSGSVYAKTLQGDGVNGVAASENFMKQGDAEIVVSGVRTYNNGDVAEPTTCTGGTVTGLTVAREKSDEMGGNFYWKITKSAGTQRGKGVAFDFTINDQVAGDDNNFSIRSQLSAEIKKISGSFIYGEDSDIKFFLFDRDTSQFVILGGGNSILGPEVKRWFNPILKSKNYTLCAHVTSSATGAYSIGLDNIVVSKAGPESRGDVNNTFTAQISNTGVITRQEPENWIQSCTGTGSKTCKLISNKFSNPLDCTASPAPGGGGTGAKQLYNVQSTPSEIIYATAENNSSAAISASISCRRTGSDYVPDAKLADQYTGMDVGLYVRGTGTSTAIMSNIPTTFTTVNYPSVAKDPSSSYNNGIWTAKKDGYFCAKASVHIERVSGSSPDAGARMARLNVTFTGSTFESSVVSLGTTFTTAMVSSQGCANLKAGQTIRADVMKEDSITSLWKITGWDAPNNFVVWESSNSQTLFRPDTFYPADVVTSEVQVGWDRSVNPIKPIYKRCHKVVSDVTTNTTLATWPTNLRPIGINKYYTGGLWFVQGVIAASGSSYITYSDVTGILHATASGTNFGVFAGTSICMEYTKP